MRNIQCLLIILVTTVVIALPRVCAALTSGDLAEFNLIYINGVNNSPEQAKRGAKKTEVLFGLPKERVRSFYNSSVGVLPDLLETYRLSGLENSATDTELFWRWSQNIGSAPLGFQASYWNITSSYDNPVAGGILAGTDLVTFDFELKILQNTKKKTIIISHSEGNFFGNLLVDRVTQRDQALGQNCTGIVAVATPSTRVTNSDPWVTSTNDFWINIARGFNSNVLGGNVTVSGFNSLLNGDPFGHTYVGTYLAWAGTSIENGVQAVVDRINKNCSDCGDPLNRPGGQGTGQTFLYTVGGGAQKLDIAFEAFHIPDRLIVQANGIVLVDTKTQVSGFNQFEINYDPALHGSFLDIIVDAPNAGTAWEFCVNCRASNKSCNLVNDRKKVNYYIDPGDFTCRIDNVFFDGQRSGSPPVTLSVGQHQFAWDGSCFCDRGALGRCPKGPSVSISGTRYPLPGQSQNSAFLFDVN